MQQSSTQPLIYQTMTPFTKLPELPRNASKTKSRKSRLELRWKSKARSLTIKMPDQEREEKVILSAE
jgi:hypothetical protein